jgi:ubiquinone/menaquinone biosynthesis C-methylase UbiE
MDHREITRNLYDKAAKKYADMWFDYKEMRPFLDKFMSMLKTGSLILDAGCGSGRDAEYIASHGFKVIGIDLSENMIREAKKWVTSKNVKLMKMDMQKMDFEDGKFDGLISISSFLHIPKNENKGAMMEFKRVLKKGGIMFVSLHEGTGEGFEKREKYYDNSFFIKYYKPEEVAKLLRSAGLEIIRIYSNEFKGRKYINAFARKP